jgi:hypothetical protein
MLLWLTLQAVTNMDVLKLFDDWFTSNKQPQRQTLAVTSGKVIDARQPEQPKNEFNMETYLERLEMVESSGGKNLRSRTSSASGAHQYTEATWLDLTKRMKVDYSLEDRFDYNKSREVTKFATQRNIELLSEVLGRQPNMVEVYMAHKLGRAGASKFFKAKPTEAINNVVSSSALKANRAVFFNDKGKPRTTTEVFEFFNERFKQ